MNLSVIPFCLRFTTRAAVRPRALACGAALMLAMGLAAAAQEPPPIPQSAPAPAADAQQPAAPSSTPAEPAASPAAAAPESQTPAPASAAVAPQSPPPAPASAAVPPPPEVLSPADSIVEEELRQQLVGKPLYLRGGYLSDNLNFDQHGRLLGSSPRSSYTLSAIEIDRVRLTRRKVELEGIRYGLHFLGALPYEDPTKALDRVRITPKKKLVKLTIDREIVIKPKAIKEKGEGRLWGRKVKDDAWTAEEQLPEVSEANQATAPAAAAPAAASTPAPAASEAPASTPAAALEASAATPVAVAPETERTADLESGTTTSPAYAAAMLKSALDRIFAPGLDDRMMAAMPDFWKLYYQAAAAKTDYRPADPAILRQNTVDKKAKLISTFEPDSNEYAQANGVAGLALYHVVIGADGKPGEIAVGRPIGFGLDENAVESIRKAQFQPAIKDGHPVPVLLDLVVQFRIYSKRTAVMSAPGSADQPAGPVLPGPYSLQQK